MLTLAWDSGIPKRLDGNATEDRAEEGAPGPECKKDVGGVKTVAEARGWLAEDAAEEQQCGQLDHVGTNGPSDFDGVLHFLNPLEGLRTHLLHFDEVISHTESSAWQERSRQWQHLGVETFRWSLT